MGLKLFTGNSNPNFAQSVANSAEIELGKSDISRFADGEVQVEIHESVRGDDVFIIQSTCPPVNENIIELCIMLDALRRASANSITAVIPYFGYARQDRKVAPRAPISAKCIADILTSCGADRIVTLDLHSAQIQGFFNCPVDHLFAIPTLARAWRDKYGQLDDVVAVSPDAGGVERVRAFAKRIQAPMAIIDKRRSGPNEAKALHLIGDVKDKTAVIVDDMIDTAGTLVQAVESLYKNGAKKVIAVCSHALLSGPAISRINESAIEKVIVTDTIPLQEKQSNCSKLEVISVAPVVAESIKRIHAHASVTSLFN
ncbi:MAG: ribose-phosphate pyrophosphokinase [Bdellovibrionales bacterium]|nr:ribose-phosphate pyrophosphokinase [Bdellovibrionales bacterium]